MPDRIERLRATVTELEAEIQELDQVDPESRALLQEALTEISRALQQPQPPEAPESIGERIRDAVYRFESEHPTLTGMLARVTDALARIGI